MHRRKFKGLFVRSNQARKSRGASLALVAAFAGVLIVCILAAYGLSNMFGASEEARNGVDAAALNLANKCIDIKVAPQGVYGDVADTSGQISLTNINRVWGKSLLVNANVVAMQNTGQAGGLAKANGEAAFTQAQSINDDLFDALTAKTTTSALFNDLAVRRSAKMLTGSKTLVASGNEAWPTAALNRGGTSNLAISKNQIPNAANMTINPVGGYAPGYQPIEVDNKPFYFVAFPLGQTPHLVSNSVFQVNRVDTQPVGNVKNPIPNSFSAIGSVSGDQVGIGSTAFAIANPQRQYQLSIPHAYLSIQLTNIAQWIVEGKQLSETPYGLAPETQWGVKRYTLKNKSILNGYASLGNEFPVDPKTKLSPTLWKVLTGLPGDYNVVLQQMTQRLQEISPTFSQGQLADLLVQQRVVSGVTRYLIYPTYTSEDQTDPTFQIAPVNSNKLPSWMNATYVADGTEKPFSTEGPLRDIPNYDWQTIDSTADPNVNLPPPPDNGSNNHYAELTATLNWEPDSGYNQCLGQLRIAHTTKCYFAVGE